MKKIFFLTIVLFCLFSGSLEDDGRLSFAEEIYYLVKNNRCDLVLEKLQPIVESDSSMSPSVLGYYAQCVFAMGDREEGLRLMLQATDRHPQAALNAAKMAFQLEDYNTALRAIRRVNNRHADGSTLELEARICVALNDFVCAESTVIRSAVLTPSLAGTVESLCVSFLNIRKFAIGSRCFQHLFRYDEAHTRTVALVSNIYDFLYKSGVRDGVVEDFDDIRIRECEEAMLSLVCSTLPRSRGKCGRNWELEVYPSVSDPDTFALLSMMGIVLLHHNATDLALAPLAAASEMELSFFHIEPEEPSKAIHVPGGTDPGVRNREPLPPFVTLLWHCVAAVAHELEKSPRGLYAYHICGLLLNLEDNVRIHSKYADRTLTKAQITSARALGLLGRGIVSADVALLYDSIFTFMEGEWAYGAHLLNIMSSIVGSVADQQNTKCGNQDTPGEFTDSSMYSTPESTPFEYAIHVAHVAIDSMIFGSLSAADLFECEDGFLPHSLARSVHSFQHRRYEALYLALHGSVDHRRWLAVQTETDFPEIVRDPYRVVNDEAASSLLSSVLHSLLHSNSCMSARAFAPCQCSAFDTNPDTCPEVCTPGSQTAAFDATESLRNIPLNPSVVFAGTLPSLEGEMSLVRVLTIALQTSRPLRFLADEVYQGCLGGYECYFKHLTSCDPLERDSVSSAVSIRDVFESAVRDSSPSGHNAKDGSKGTKGGQGEEKGGASEGGEGRFGRDG
eukprot:Rmarinus@m.1357